MNHSNALRAVVALALSAAAIGAHATICSNGATNWPTCTLTPPPSATPSAPPSSTSQSTSQSGAQAQAGSSAGAAAIASGGSARQGQGQGQGQDQGQGQTQSSASGAMLTDNSSGGSFKSNMWVLPAPVFTPPLPPIAGCPGANIEQFAAAVGWSFASIAKASVNTDNCTAITLYNSYVATCKWASAQQVLDLLSAKVLPGFQPSKDLGLVDLTPAGCTALLAPVVNNITNRYETFYTPPAPTPAPPACVPPAKKAKPKAKAPAPRCDRA